MGWGGGVVRMRSRANIRHIGRWGSPTVLVVMWLAAVVAGECTWKSSVPAAVAVTASGLSRCHCSVSSCALSPQTSLVSRTGLSCICTHTRTYLHRYAYLRAYLFTYVRSTIKCLYVRVYECMYLVISVYVCTYVCVTECDIRPKPCTFFCSTFSFISGVVIRAVVVIINADHTEDNTDGSRRPIENI